MFATTCDSSMLLVLKFSNTSKKRISTSDGLVLYWPTKFEVSYFLLQKIHSLLSQKEETFAVQVLK